MLAPMRVPGWIVYAVALIGILVAGAMRFTADPVLGDHASFSIFFLAVSIAAWMGGIRAAAFTAAVSCLVGSFFFTHPQFSFAITSHEELFSLVLFVAVSLIIGGLSEISLRALERARIAEQAKDDFMATLAHELRSPLTVIHYANALNRMAGSDDARDHVELIDRQVRHLNLMIQDLLDVSRVARGKIRLDRQHIDASEVAQGAIAKATPVIASRQHQLTVEMSPDPMPILADAARMEQVLSNLLTNAAKYTPDGGEIQLRAEPLGDSVVVTVRDNGIGIPQEMLPHVFELFVQVDAHSKRAGGGLGIGLSLVRKLVEMHGGYVRASSKGENRGSEFVVALPLDMPAPSRLTFVRARSAARE